MQQKRLARPIIEVYSVNDEEITKIMVHENRSKAYVANALIEEALVHRGIKNEVSVKL